MKYITAILVLCILFAGGGCKKYLDKKSNKQLVTPLRVADVQALLDNSNAMNQYAWGLGESSADDYYLTAKDWSSLYSDAERNAYTWGDELVFNAYPNQWSVVYQSIYFANVVLDQIGKVIAAGKAELDNARGSALFFRANAFYKIASVWANAYDEVTAENEPGIPLRLNSDFNTPSQRSSLADTYLQIIGDLKASIVFLPAYPQHVMRPSKAAAYGLLARILLSMRRYEQAGLYADSCLQLQSALMDFNTISSAAQFPVKQFNQETIFYTSGTYSPLIFNIAKIDSALYNSYQENDLRRTIFFKPNSDGSHGFYGHYTGGVVMFTGIAVDEQYLIKAECDARAGNPDAAMQTLNNLLRTRWKTGAFIPLTAASQADALSIIIDERRKELLMRDLRWMDIKRLNKGGAGISLKRVFADKVFELPAGSPKFALPLPDYIIKMTGMQQNPR